MYSNLKYKFEQLKNDYLTGDQNREISLSEFVKEMTNIIDEYEEKLKGAILWSKEDFIGRAMEQFDYEMNEDDAENALEEMINNHDCTIGITWETLDYYIEQYINSETK